MWVCLYLRRLARQRRRMKPEQEHPFTALPPNDTMANNGPLASKQAGVRETETYSNFVRRDGRSLSISIYGDADATALWRSPLFANYLGAAPVWRKRSTCSSNLRSRAAVALFAALANSLSSNDDNKRPAIAAWKCRKVALARGDLIKQILICAQLIGAGSC